MEKLFLSLGKLAAVVSPTARVVAISDKVSEKVFSIETTNNKVIVGEIDGKVIISSGVNTPEAFGLEPFGSPYYQVELKTKSDYKAPTMRSNIKKGKRR